MNQDSTTFKRPFIPALTGLRAICAYGIFFYHVNRFSKDSQPLLYRFLDQFYSFIPFFFVISGFVIFYTYYKKEGYKKNELYNYVVSRIARIFPLLIILNTLVFLLSYREQLYTLPETIKLYLLNITLLKGFSAEYILTGVGPSWTNSVEEIFYLLAPLIFLWVLKRYFLIKLTFFFYLLGFLITLLFIYFPFEGFFANFPFTAYCTFFGRVFEFVCGIYLALLYMGIKQNKFLEKTKRKTIWIAVTLIALSFFAQFYISGKFNVEHANEVWPGIIVNNIILPIGIFFLLYSLIYCRSSFQKFLSTNLVVKLGNATYSFYLLHGTFVISYIYKFISYNVFITFISMVVISYIVYKFVEQPLARFLRKKLSKA